MLALALPRPRRAQPRPPPHHAAAHTLLQRLPHKPVMCLVPDTEGNIRLPNGAKAHIESTLSGLIDVAGPVGWSARFGKNRTVAGMHLAPEGWSLQATIDRDTENDLRCLMLRLVHHSDPLRRMEPKEQDRHRAWCAERARA